jgi:hypothetical protein
LREEGMLHPWVFDYGSADMVVSNTKAIIINIYCYKYQSKLIEYI